MARRTASSAPTPLPQGYAAAGLISADEAATLRGYVAPAVPSPAVAATMLTVLAKVSRADTQQYILVAIDDIVSCGICFTRFEPIVPVADRCGALLPCRGLRRIALVSSPASRASAEVFAALQAQNPKLPLDPLFR